MRFLIHFCYQFDFKILKKFLPLPYLRFFPSIVSPSWSKTSFVIRSWNGICPLVSVVFDRKKLRYPALNQLPVFRTWPQLPSGFPDSTNTSASFIFSATMQDLIVLPVLSISIWIFRIEGRYFHYDHRSFRKTAEKSFGTKVWKTRE